MNVDSPQQSNPEMREQHSNDQNQITNLFENEEELQEFKKFLAAEFCLENLLVCLNFHRLFIVKFVEHVTLFRAAPTLELAKEIARRYIGTKSRTPINIAGPSADQILGKLAKNEFSLEMFDLACNEIIQLLKNDSLRRFTKTLRVKNNVSANEAIPLSKSKE